MDEGYKEAMHRATNESDEDEWVECSFAASVVKKMQIKCSSGAGL